jgi:hypothetical protein
VVSIHSTPMPLTQLLVAKKLCRRKVHLQLRLNRRPQSLTIPQCPSPMIRSSASDDGLKRDMTSKMQITVVGWSFIIPVQHKNLDTPFPNISPKFHLKVLHQATPSSSKSTLPCETSPLSFASTPHSDIIHCLN